MIHRRFKFPALFAAAIIIVYVFQSGSNQIGLNFLPMSSEDRPVRAAPDDKLKDSIEKLQMVARLTNVLYLQVGLTNGNEFDSEVLISELLHFGDVQPKAIQNLKFSEIETALNELKALPTKFEKDEVIKKIEDVFLSVKKILNEMDGVPKAEKWDGKDDYAADLEKIKNGDVKFDGDVKELRANINSWTHYLSQVQKDQDNPTDPSDLTKWKTTSEQLKNGALSLQKNPPVLFQFSKGQKAKDAINSLVKVENSLKLLDGIYAIKGNDFDQLQAYFQPASNFESQMKTVRMDIGVVERVYSYRLNPGLSPSFEYTPGLLEGYEDVSVLNDNFKDAWFNQVVKNNSIAAAYPSVQSLSTTMNGIQRLLGTPNSEPLETLRGIFVVSDKFQRFSDFPFKDAKTIAGCISEFSTRSSQSFVTELAELTKDIDDQFENFKKILNSSAEAVLKDQTNFDNLIEELGKVDSADLPSAYKHILSLESVKSIETTLLGLKFDGLDTTSLIQYANNAIAKLGGFDDYAKIIENYYDYIQCLLENKEKAPKVTDAIDHSKNLQNLQNNAFNEKIDKGLQYVTGVANTLEGLNSLTTEIQSVKGNSKLETKPLKNLNETDAMIIGMATRGVVNMKTLIDRKSEFDVFKTHSQLIKDEKNKHSSKLQPDEMTLLDNIIGLEASLDTMYNELETWKTTINSQNFSTLDSFSVVFTEAEKVNVLKEDVSKMTKALRKLIELVEAEDNTSSTRRKRSTDNLNEIKNALISLADLQFSKFSSEFANTKETLSSIDMFFANYVKDLMKLFTSPIPPKRIQHVDGPGASKEELEEYYRDKNMWRYIYGGSGALFVIVLVVVGVTLWCCCRKKRMPCNQTIKKFTHFNLKHRVALRYLRSLQSQIEAIGASSINEKRAKEGKEETLYEQKARNNIFYQFCASICDACEEGRVEKIRPPYDKLRKLMVVPCNMRTDSAIKLGLKTDLVYKNSTFYHGNLMIMRNLLKVILMQGVRVLTKEEKENDKEREETDKDSTIDQLWKLIKKYKVKTIVMLSGISKYEGARYFADGLKDEFRVDEDSLIRCVAKNENDHITTRQLEYFEKQKDKDGQEILHLQITNWREDELPKTGQVRKILEQVRASEGPTMVHCNDGIGRTGAFVYTEKLLQAIHFSKNEDGRVDHGDLIREMRESRACCIQRPENLMVPIMTVLDMCFDKIKSKDVKFIKEPTKRKSNGKFDIHDYNFYHKLVSCYNDLRTDEKIEKD